MHFIRFGDAAVAEILGLGYHPLLAGHVAQAIENVVGGRVQAAGQRVGPLLKQAGRIELIEQVVGQPDVAELNHHAALVVQLLANFQGPEIVRQALLPVAQVHVDDADAAQVLGHQGLVVGGLGQAQRLLKQFEGAGPVALAQGGPEAVQGLALAVAVANAAGQDQRLAGIHGRRIGALRPELVAELAQQQHPGGIGLGPGQQAAQAVHGRALQRGGRYGGFGGNGWLGSG